MRLHWQSVRNRVRNWWNEDQIRISPETGALWRLQPGAVLTINQRNLTVLSRRQLCGSEQSLEYTCHDGSASHRLRVLATPEATEGAALWNGGADPLRFCQVDVQIWATGETLASGD